MACSIFDEPVTKGRMSTQGLRARLIISSFAQGWELLHMAAGCTVWDDEKDSAVSHLSAVKWFHNMRTANFSAQG